jgi:hypothetical protein
MLAAALGNLLQLMGGCCPSCSLPEPFSGSGWKCRSRSWTVLLNGGHMFRTRVRSSAGCDSYHSLIYSTLLTQFLPSRLNWLSQASLQCSPMTHALSSGNMIQGGSRVTKLTTPFSSASVAACHAGLSSAPEDPLRTSWGCEQWLSYVCCPRPSRFPNSTNPSTMDSEISLFCFAKTLFHSVKILLVMYLVDWAVFYSFLVQTNCWLADSMGREGSFMDWFCSLRFRLDADSVLCFWGWACLSSSSECCIASEALCALNGPISSQHSLAGSSKLGWPLTFSIWSLSVFTLLASLTIDERPNVLLTPLPCELALSVIALIYLFIFELKFV